MRFILYSFFALCLVSSFLPAQTLIGTVLGASNEGLPGASIRVEGRDVGTLTYTDGRFRIQLDKGINRLEFSYLGYADSVITIHIQQDTSITIHLQTNDVQLETVEITRGKKDPAYAIMKKVIANKKSHYKQFDTYNCESYMKLRIERDTMPNARQRKAIIDSLGTDSLPEPGENKRLVKLIESHSDIYYKAPGRYKTVVKGYYNSANRPNPSGVFGQNYNEFGSDTRDPYLFYMDVSDADFNFYKNLIQAPGLSDRPYISPLHDALWSLTYSYRLISTGYIGNKLVYEIAIEPHNAVGPTFSGTIWIEKGSYAIHKLDLLANPSSLIFFKSLQLRHSYQALNAQARVLALEQYNYSIKDGRVWIFGENETSYKNYQINIEHPKGRFNNEVRRTEQEAYERDSSYWASVRPVALQPAEQIHKFRQDSISIQMMSPEHLAELDSAYNQNGILDFLFNGVTYRNRAAGMRYYFNAIAEQIRPLGVGGYRHALGGSATKTWERFTSLTVAGELNYGFNNNDLKGNMRFSYGHDPVHFGRAFFRFGDQYVLVNNFATIANILSRSNFVRKVNVGGGYRRELFNGFFGRVSIDYADRTPINDLNLSEWSQNLFGGENEPASFDPYREFILTLRVNYTPGQKYQREPYRKIRLGSKWPTFGIEYRKAIAGVAGSELNYDYVEIGAKQEFKVGAMGTSRWKARAGRFLQASNIRFTDLKFIRGTDPYFFAAPMDAFQLLGPTLSTQNAWFEGHYLHDFAGTLIEKIPLLKRLPLEAQAGGGVLAMEDGNFLHGELFAGVGVPFRILKTRIKLAAYYVTSYSNIDRALQGQFKFGISVFDPIRRRWNF